MLDDKERGDSPDAMDSLIIMRLFMRLSQAIDGEDKQAALKAAVTLLGMLAAEIALTRPDRQTALVNMLSNVSGNFLEVAAHRFSRQDRDAFIREMREACVTLEALAEGAKRKPPDPRLQ